MLEERNLRLDVAALGLTALTVFFAAALWSYDPADPPSSLVYPPRSETQNLCGPVGAMAASLLLNALGVGAYYLLLTLGVLDAVLLTRRRVSQPVVRSVGWLISLVGLTTLVAMALPQLSPGPVIGAGGYLGAAGRGLLEMHFASVGAYILAVSLVIGGLLLSTDYLLLKLSAWIFGVPARRIAGGLGISLPKVTALRRAAPQRTRRSDLDEATEEAEEDEPARAPPSQAIRVVRRDADRGREAADEAEDEGADDESQESEAPPAPLRIRKPARSRRDELIDQLEAAESDEPVDYELPSVDLLAESEPFSFEVQERDVRQKAKILEKTFLSFGFNVRVVEIQTGPVIAQFEVELEAGLRLSKITGLADDLAIALRVPSVRIVAPIPGKNTVGVEVPNRERQLVRLREVMEESEGKAQKMRIPLFLGKDVAGSPMVVDLSSLPHLLIAGRTGTGKSVCLNSMIVSMLMTRRPDEVRLLLIDPKMVELSPYKRLPHLMHPVVTDMRKAEAILGWAVEKMEERYHLLAQAGVRHISSYNQLGEEELFDRIQPTDEDEQRQIPSHLPYIVIVADEMADLMMTAAKEVEAHIIRLAQKSRAVGIHLVLATQKPTVDVITGLIKSNLPARIAFQVASRTDSRVVLDEMGADRLLGNGDLLFLWPGTSTLIRGQGTYLADEEINRVIETVSCVEPQFVRELVQLKTEEEGAAPGLPLSSRDELYEAAVDVVIREGRGSVSLLQRTLGIGYGRAARLIDAMAEDGIVGSYNGSQARDVVISLADWEARRQGGSAGAAAVDLPPPPKPPKPPRTASPSPSNRIRLEPPDDEEWDEEPYDGEGADDEVAGPQPRPSRRRRKPAASPSPKPPSRKMSRRRPSAGAAKPRDQEALAPWEDEEEETVEDDTWTDAEEAADEDESYEEDEEYADSDGEAWEEEEEEDAEEEWTEEDDATDEEEEEPEETGKPPSSPQRSRRGRKGWRAESA